MRLRLVALMALAVLLAGIAPGPPEIRRPNFWGGVATGAPAPAQPQRGGRLVIAMSVETSTLDVHALPHSWIVEANQYIYETLTDRDDQGRVIPWLARSWRVTNSGKTVTLNLQPGVKFSDGTPFNAEAAKWNLERKLKEKLPFHDLITSIDSIDVVNDMTLRLNLKHPALHLMATLSLKPLAMMSPTAFRKYGKDIAVNPVGTGPFTLAEWRKGQFLRFKRNPDYWRPGLPYVDEIVLRTIPDIAVRAQALEAGEVDIALHLSEVDIQRMQSNPKYRVTSAPAWGQYYMPMNNHERRGILNDRRVRQAINHAIDRKAMVDTIFLGVGARVSDAPGLTSGIFGYAPVGTYSYDPARARALLAEAGWRPGPGGLVERDGRALRLRLVTRRGAVKGDIQIAETLQAQLKAIGIDLRIDVLEGAIFLRTVTQPPERADYDILNLTVGTFNGDADYLFNLLLSCKAWPPARFNRMFYCNPQLDQILEKANVATDNPTRLGLYQEMARIVHRDAPFIILFDIVYSVVMQASVHGVEIHRAGNFPARFAWTEKGR
ncbi:MAG: hypothetical protein HY660_06930 [Armatimonadetes bacterium]|nr:hypothetical protein [Armatimonadota bacterium]